MATQQNETMSVATTSMLNWLRCGRATTAWCHWRAREVRSNSISRESDSIVLADAIKEHVGQPKDQLRARPHTFEEALVRSAYTDINWIAIAEYFLQGADNSNPRNKEN